MSSGLEAFTIKRIRGPSKETDYADTAKELRRVNQREMFEKSFERPSNYFELSDERQWEIDAGLGILDWEGKDLSEEDRARYQSHYRKHQK